MSTASIRQGFRTALRQLRHEKKMAGLQTRSVTTSTFAYRPPKHHVSGKLYTGVRAPASRLKKLLPPMPSPGIKSACAKPLETFVQGELDALDPSGARRRLISRANEERVKVGDVALVRFRSGEPFAGLVLSVRHRGPDSGILLRNQLTRVGTELWVKVFSPTVSGIEIVQRSERRMRRARAYYFRKTRHDRGSLAGVVDNYIRQSRLLGRGGGGTAETASAGGGKKKR